MKVQWQGQHNHTALTRRRQNQTVLIVPTSHTVCVYLGHLQSPHCKGLVATNCPVPIPLSSLDPDLQDVASSLQEMRVLHKGTHHCTVLVNQRKRGRGVRWTCRAKVSWRGMSRVPEGGRGISLERRKRCGVFIATATTTEGRLGSRVCLTSSLVTVTVHSLFIRSKREL